MIEVARAILELRGRDHEMYFNDLVNEIQTYLEKSNSEIREALPLFYTELNVDGSFIPLGDNKWGLRSLIAELGWVDIWRTLYSETPGYTWWSQRGQAYAKDVGWRIDYQMATPDLAERARSAHVYKQEKFSDHAPLVVDYDYPL